MTGLSDSPADEAKRYQAAIDMAAYADANGFVMNDTLGGPDELVVEGEGISFFWQMSNAPSRGGWEGKSTVPVWVVR